MKALIVTIFVTALLGTGSFVFAHGSQGGWFQGWHRDHHGSMMGFGDRGHCDGDERMKDVEVKVEKSEDGVTIKMTSENKDQVKEIQEHVKRMERYHYGR